LSLHLLVLPRRNEPELEDVTEDVRRELEFVLVDVADEVLTATLLPVKQTELMLVG
jgi:ATP-dependent Lon protease